VNPTDDLTPHIEFDPSTLPVPNGDIGLWSGEGTDNPFWTTPHTLLPADDPHGDLSGLPNGGPGGVSALKEYTREDWLRAEEQKAKAKQEYDEKHKLKKWEDMQKETGDAGGGRSWIDDAIDYLFGDWSLFYTDPDQSTAPVLNPHDMVASLLGKGASALPDGLGFDKELIGRMLVKRRQVRRLPQSARRLQGCESGCGRGSPEPVRTGGIRRAGARAPAAPRSRRHESRRLRESRRLHLHRTDRLLVAPCRKQRPRRRADVMA
jgi:hypothetical protein